MAGKRLDVLLFPEWYGVAAHAKAYAKMLGELNYADRAMTDPSSARHVAP
jgi:hypothetical protein